jgi:hypothetical protein
VILKQVEVSDSIEIPFDWKDNTPGGGNLGRAEFNVCIRYLRGKVREVFIYPRQQRRFNYWHRAGYFDQDFTIGSYGELGKPEVWRVGWCKEHKCQTLEIYVPTGSAFLRIDHNGISFWPAKGDA